MPDFNDLLSQAKKMQEKMKEAQTKLKNIEVEGIAGGNSVKAVLNGDGELIKISLDENIIKESKEIIEDLIVAAHNDAKLKLKKKNIRRNFKSYRRYRFTSGFQNSFLKKNVW